MASLVGLRSLVYTYLGTTSSDPAYPAASVNALINASGNALIADIHQARPDYFLESVILTPSLPAARQYTPPAGYAGWLDVRLSDKDGTPLSEVRYEELARSSAPVFAVTGPDSAPTLTASDAVELNAAIYLLYRTQPAELVVDADVPTWLPAHYHDLLARKAAIDAFGLGNESTPSPLFVASTEDREAQLWVSIGRRGVAPTIQR